MIGPAIGSSIVGSLVLAEPPQSLLHRLAYLGLTTLFLSLGLTHGTTLALLCGYWFGWWAIAYWLPFFLIAQCAGLIFGRLMVAKAGGLEQVTQSNPKWSSALSDFKQKLAYQGDWAVFWFRMSPVVPFALGTVLLAQTGMKILSMVFYGTLGAIPRTLAVAQIGMVAGSLPDLLSGSKSPDWSLWAGLAFLIISTVGLTWWAKQDQGRR